MIGWLSPFGWVTVRIAKWPLFIPVRWIVSGQAEMTSSLASLFLRIIKCGDSGISTAGHKSYYSRAWEFTQFVQCRLQLAAKAHVRRSIQTDFPMTTLTDRELEVLIGLRTNWRELYSKELARLVNDDTKRAVDRLRMPCDPALLKTQRGTHIFDDPD